MGTLPQVQAAPVPRTERRPRLPALTGIRAFVSMNIVFFHFSDPKWFGPLAPLVDGGFVGVSFFFVLSGFILSYNYGSASADGPSRPLSPVDFWRTRLSRLYPIYLLSLLVSYRVLMDEWHAQTRAHFFQGIVLTPLMLQSWSPTLSTFWNTPGWALSCEVFFYAMLPWLIALRWPSTHRKGGMARLIGVLGMVWLAGMILPAIYVWLNPDGIAHVDRYSYGFWLRAVKFTPLPHVPEFLFGLGLGRLQGSIQLGKVQRLLLAVSGLAAMLEAMRWSGAIPFVLLHDGALMPVFAMIILGLAGDHLLADFFSFWPFVALGEASYCLYLLHFNLWELAHHYRVWERLHLAALDPWISYAFVIAAALAAYRWIERPGRKWMLARMGA